MNITVNTTALAQELRLACRVVPEKPAIPILSHVLVTAGDRLTISATNLELMFQTTCRGVGSGSAAIPAQRLLSIIEQLPDGEVQIVVDDRYAHISSGSFKSRLQVLAVEDFPAAPVAPSVSSRVPTEELLAMVRKTRYAIADKSKFVVAGALLSVTESVSALVATDGKRLSLVTSPMKVGAIGKVIIPTKALDTLEGLFGGGFVNVAQTERHLFFSSDDRLLISRMLEGVFPAYDRIIPRDADKVASVNRSVVAAALRRVGLLAEENAAVQLLFEAGVLTLSSSSHDAGDALEAVPINYEGPVTKVCCSWRFLLDFFEAAVEATVTISLKDDHTPLLLTDGSNFINVVMLMRV